MDVHFFFGVLGNAIALFLSLAPMVTFWRIIKSKSTEQFSGVPYIMTLLSCLLAAWYGLPFVSPHNLLVSTINGTGTVLQSAYIVIYIAYAPKKVKVQIMALLAVVLVVFSSVSLVSYFFLCCNTRKLFCGLALTIFSILIMYASPLSAMRLVIRTKSVEFMPFFLSLFVFLCGTSWLIFGLLGHDPFVVIPNGFGCGLGALQLILYFTYRNNKDGNDKGGGKATTVDESMEMGFGKPDQKVMPDNNNNKRPSQDC